MGDAMGHGPQQWSMNSEAISLEIIRHASRLAGRTSTAYLDRWTQVNHHLRTLLTKGFISNSTRLKTFLLPFVISTVHRASSSSPIELYNSFVSTTPSPLPSTSARAPLYRRSTTTTLSAHVFLPASSQLEASRMTDIVNRISQIITLNWHIWATIAYVQDEEIGCSGIALAKDCRAQQQQQETQHQDQIRHQKSTDLGPGTGTSTSMPALRTFDSRSREQGSSASASSSSTSTPASSSSSPSPCSSPLISPCLCPSSSLPSTSPYSSTSLPSTSPYSSSSSSTSPSSPSPPPSPSPSPSQ